MSAMTHSGNDKTFIKNVLHVPTMTKNLVFVGQIFEQSMHVRFDQGGCFIEKEGRLIAPGRREGRMFILDSHEIKSTKADSNIELSHKRIGHINLNKLKTMQSKGLAIGLSTFKEKGIEGVCEACQFFKQHQHPFLKERNVSKGLLDVIHSDVVEIFLADVWKSNGTTGVSNQGN